MNAITVCVDYDDFLAITLPANHAYFEKIVVVTDLRDERTVAVAARFPNVVVHRTDAFYARGAPFNKGAALEEGFDVLGRDGWICVLDADILLPPDFALPELSCGYLYGARRRILERAESYSPELNWRDLPLSIEGPAGYFQLFHAADPRLIPPPWYPLDWEHAGVSDTIFQMRWPLERQTWLPLEVLHLGPCTANWHRRITPRIDSGEMPAEAEQRRARMEQMFALRQTHGFARERLGAGDERRGTEAAARGEYGGELIYSRDGFPDVRIVLHESGAILNGPGFNEQRWRAAGDRLEFLCRDGIPRVEMTLQSDGGYAGL